MKSDIGLEVLAVLVVVFGVSFMLTMDCLSRREPQVAVTTPLAILEPSRPAVTVLGRSRGVVRKRPVVVVPVVVGAANCPEVDDRRPCQRIYEFRQRCSLGWMATKGAM